METHILRMCAGDEVCRVHLLKGPLKKQAGVGGGAGLRGFLPSGFAPSPNSMYLAKQIKA